MKVNKMAARFGLTAPQCKDVVLWCSTKKVARMNLRNALFITKDNGRIHASKPCGYRDVPAHCHVIEFDNRGFLKSSHRTSGLGTFILPPTTSH